VTLGSGATTTEVLTVATESGDVGTYTAQVASENDTASTGVRVDAPATFDVTLTSVDPAVTAGETISIAYEVTNTGDVQATQNIGFRVNGTTEGTESGVTLNGSEIFNGQFSYQTVGKDISRVSLTVSSNDDAAGRTVPVLCDVGDVDRDGDINIVDAVRIQRQIAGLDPSPFNPVLADVNRDGEVGIVDAVRIQRLLAALDEPGAAVIRAVDAPSSVAPGDPLPVSATVENPGDLGTLQTAEFRLVANNSGPNVTEVVNLLDLASGESVNSTTELNTTGLTPGSYTLEIATEDDTKQTPVTVTSSSTVTGATRVTEENGPVSVTVPAIPPARGYHTDTD